jgi:hypothetical protein
VEGETKGTSAGAAGVAGSATNDATEPTFGVFGETRSSSELAAGVAGISSDEGAPAGSGVLGLAVVESATAGTFLNLPGTGKVISGRSGFSGNFDPDNGFPIGPFPEVFRVEGDGDVVANTGDLQALGAGKGLVLKSPDGTHCARISLNNSGTSLDFTSVTCP